LQLAFLVQVLTALCKLDACRKFFILLIGLSRTVLYVTYPTHATAKLNCLICFYERKLVSGNHFIKILHEVIFLKHKATWAIEKIPVFLRNKNLIRTPIYEVKVVSDN
jgi:hypothetical protein